MVMLTIGLVLTVDRCVLTSAISCAPLNILPSSVTHEQLENVGDVSCFFFFFLTGGTLPFPHQLHPTIPHGRHARSSFDSLKPLMSYLISLNFNFLHINWGLK